MYTLLRPRGKHKYWCVRITLPGQPIRELSTKCKLKRDARPVAERLHSEAASGLRREKLLDALGSLIGLRIRQKRAGATIEKLTEKGEQLIKFFGEDKDVLTMSVDDATDYVVHRRAQGVSDSTIAMEWTVMTAAMRRLRKRELLPYEPESRWPDELEHDSSEAKERWLPWKEYLLVLAAIVVEFRDHFALYCAMGLRWSELYRLQKSDLRHVDRLVDGAKVPGLEVRVRGTKTKEADRVVPANPDAEEILLKRAKERPSGPLFPITHGKVQAQETAWARALKAACRAAGVEPASTNDLRRTFASRAFQNGVDEALLIKWMGHTSSKMVRRIYAKASSDQHQREVEKMPSRSKRKPAPKRGEAEEG